MILQDRHSRNQDSARGLQLTESNPLHGKNKKELGRITLNDPEASKEGESDFEISSSATIKWCCSIALHLLQLSLNINEKRPRAFKLQEIKSDK